MAARVFLSRQLLVALAAAAGGGVLLARLQPSARVTRPPEAVVAFLGDVGEVRHEVVASVACDSITAGNSAAGLAVVRNGIPIDLRGRGRLEVGDEIVISMSRSDGREGTGRGTFVAASGAQTYEFPWQIRFRKRVALTLVEVLAAGPVAWGDEVDVQWRIENREPKTGWERRIAVHCEDWELVHEFVGEQAGGLVTLVTRWRCPARWGDHSGAYMQVDIDGTADSARWEVALKQPAGGACGLVYAKRRRDAGQWEAAIDVGALSAGSKPLDAQLRVTKHVGCSIGLQPVDGAARCECLITARAGDAWYGEVEGTAGGLPVRWVVLPRDP